MQTDDVKVILVLASWSSGSTSVAGYLDKCGAYSCPPHVMTVDERTPNAYEPRELMRVLTLCFDEQSLQPTARLEAFGVFFPNWIAREKEKAAAAGKSFVVLKHPLQSLVLPAIMRAVPDARIVVVSRPFEKIEATRARRLWPAAYGDWGAKIIYSATYTWLHDNSVGYVCVPYERFRNEAPLRSEMLTYLGLQPDADALADADAFLK